MNARGHARLMLAIFAAVGLHALLFAAFPSEKRVAITVPQGAMRLDLLSEPKSAEHKAANAHVAPEPRAAAESARPQARQSRARQAPHRVPRHRTAASPVKMLAASQPHTVRKKVLSGESPAQAKQVQPSAHATHASSESASVHAPPAAPGVVPQEIQQSILAAVRYPRLARRQGWQGRAEFEIDVDRQGIHAVTLLSSTGYPLLDRAAERGIASVGRIPLSNGLYRMPVIFVLR